MWAWLRNLFGASEETPAAPPISEPVRTDPPRLRVIDGGLSKPAGLAQLLALTGQSAPVHHVLTERAQRLPQEIRRTARTSARAAIKHPHLRRPRGAGLQTQAPFSQRLAQPVGKTLHAHASALCLFN